jgi:glutamine amidotransferase
MSWAFALASGDPNLVGCVLAALAAEAPLKPTLPPEAYGIAYYQSDEALLERRPTGGQAFDLERLGRHMESELLLAQAQSAGDLLPSLPKDENTQPLRFRRWLFAQVGHLSGFPSLYPALKRNLPEFLERQIKGDTDAEVVFMHVLKQLRSRGLADGATPGSMAASMGDAIRDLERAQRNQGVTVPNPLGLFLTDGKSLAVTAAGAPLSMRLIEGLVPCARCEISERTPELNPLLRPHRRLRAAVFASGLRPGFRAIEERTTVTVSSQLDVRVEPVA